jgi:glycosyltransferase involved in cell wall biosynthesis
VKVLLVSTHPVQYAAPLFRLYAKDLRLEVTVAYCSLQGAEPGMDPEFGVEVVWDVPLLEGYRWVHPPNRSLRPHLRGFLGLINPGLLTLILQERPDVVVCYGWRTASFWIAALTAKLTRARLVFTTDAHSIRAREGLTSKAALKRVILPIVLRFPAAVFAPSSRTFTYLKGLGLREERIFLTPYVVDNGFFARRSSRVDRGPVRRRWGVQEDAFVVLFCGKLVPWKRPQDLLEAVARVPGAWAVLAGEGSLRAALERRAQASDLAGRVRFLGFVNQQGLPEVYAGSDALVLPSDYEPFGLVVNEAFACGLPAVVTEACGAAGDLVRDGVTGYVAPVGDVDILAERLARLSRDPALARAMGEKARARIGEWGPEQNAEAFARACLTISRHQQ